MNIHVLIVAAKETATELVHLLKQIGDIQAECYPPGGKWTGEALSPTTLLLLDADAVDALQVNQLVQSGHEGIAVLFSPDAASRLEMMYPLKPLGYLPKPVLYSNLKAVVDAFCCNLQECEEKYSSVTQSPQKAEEHPDASERFFRENFMGHKAVILVIEPEAGRIKEANQAAVDFYGYSKKELLQKHIQEINTKPPEQVAQDMCMAASEARNVFYFQHRLADGSIRDVHVFSSQITYRNKPALFSIIHDVTATRNIERRLVENERKFRHFIASTPFGVCLLDKDLLVKEWNDAMVEITGHSCQKYFGKPATEFFNSLSKRCAEDEDLQKIARLKQFCLQPRQTNMQEIVKLNSAKHGSIYLQLNISYHKDRELLISIIVTDITKEKKAEINMKKALEGEKTLNAIRRSFISLASHQFKTPLTSISSSNQLIRFYAEKGEQASFSKIISHTRKIDDIIQWLNDIISKFLFLSREEAGRIPYKPAYSNLNKLIKQVLDSNFQHEGQKRKIFFIAKKKECWAYIDAGLMKHALINLISNALKYSQNEVRIKLSQKSGQPLIHVCNRGTGIDEEDLPHIFEAFYRGKNAANTKGSGLGLVITKRVVDINRGSIQVNSVKNKGTCFSVVLPYNKGEIAKTYSQQ